MIIVLVPSSYAQTADKTAETLHQRAAATYKRVEQFKGKDSLQLYRNIIASVKASFESNDIDTQPNKKGKIKPQFLRENLQRITKLYPRLIDAGIYLSKQSAYREEGMQALDLYLSHRKNLLVSDLPDESGLAAYYLAYYHFAQRSYAKADEYANMALQYDETALEAAEIKAECMYAQMANEDDSLKYLAVLRKLYEIEPTSDTYFSWIMRFYQKPTAKFNLENFVDRELEEGHQSPIPWILKGEIAMRAKRWDEALEAYQTADEIDPTSVPVAFNIGVCLNMKGVELYKVFIAQQEKNEAASSDAYKSVFAQARNYLERVRAKDPHRKRVDWLRPLYMVYTILKDDIKAAELEPLVSNFK